MALEIRPPHPAEGPACRMLLPQAFTRGQCPDVLLAFADRQVAGAIAFHARGRQIGLVGLRVVRTHRRQGIGTQLLRHLCADPLSARQTHVSAFADSLASPEAAPFLTANGFERAGRLFVFEADLDRMLAGMGRLRDRLVASGRVPPQARLVTPSEAPLDQITALFDRYILSERCLRPEFLRPPFASPRFQESSVVLLMDGRVAGLVLVEWLRDIHRAEVPARIVIPEYRGGWANVLMMAVALERGKAAGIKRVRFDSLEDNADTLSLARRFNADTVHILDRFLREVGGRPTDESAATTRSQSVDGEPDPEGEFRKTVPASDE